MEMLKHKFVDSIPEDLEQGIIYISCARRTAIHLCVCGCGNEVVTPLAPTDWQLEFNGETVSLSPSIGLWEFRCRSHYWIIHNEIKYSGSWTDQQVLNGRIKDKKQKEAFYAQEKGVKHESISLNQQAVESTSIFEKLKSFFLF
jgi:hypothetical protein